MTKGQCEPYFKFKISGRMFVYVLHWWRTENSGKNTRN